MKHRILVLSALVAGLVFALAASAQETKTDLSRDVYVEYSTTNFVLTSSAATPAGKAAVAYNLTAPEPGQYKLVCFVNGKASQLPVDFKAPGAFKLSTRGLAPGSYRVTLQLIHPQGGVGRATSTLEVK
jgi:hypothetical protein